MPTLSRRSKIIIGLGVAVLVLLLVGPRLIGLATDWLWFSDVGYSSVFTKVIWTRVILFLITTIVVGLIIFGAVSLAYRSRPVFVPTAGPNDPLARYRTAIMGKVRWFAIVPAVIIGALAGLVAACHGDGPAAGCPIIQAMNQTDDAPAADATPARPRRAKT